jgi:hypothetical protein
MLTWQVYSRRWNRANLAAVGRKGPPGRDDQSADNHVGGAVDTREYPAVLLSVRSTLTLRPVRVPHSVEEGVKRAIQFRQKFAGGVPSSGWLLR